MLNIIKFATTACLLLATANAGVSANFQQGASISSAQVGQVIDTNASKPIHTVYSAYEGAHAQHPSNNNLSIRATVSDRHSVDSVTTSSLNFWLMILVGAALVVRQLGRRDTTLPLDSITDGNHYKDDNDFDLLGGISSERPMQGSSEIVTSS